MSIPQDVQKKHCPKCDRDLPATPENFKRCKNNRDGLDRICKQCHHILYLKTVVRNQEIAKQSQHPQTKQCNRCHRDLPATADYFSRDKSQKDGLRVFCKECRHGDYLSDLARYPDFNKQAGQRQRAAFLAKSPKQQQEELAWRAINGRNRRAAKRNTGVCHRCFSRPCEPGRKKCEQCKSFERRYKQTSTTHKASAKRLRDLLRDQVFAAYGSQCAYCGEARQEFLSVDHVYNDGAEHRRVTGGSGYRMYVWLRKHGYPQEGFQLLCRNCNHAKFVYGKCPHQCSTQ